MSSGDEGPEVKRRRLRRGDTQDEDDAFNDEDNDLDEAEEDERWSENEEEARLAREEAMYFSQDEESEGEDLLENAEGDYRRMDALDTYDIGQLDDRRYDTIDEETRRRVEEELDRRDAREGRLQKALIEDQEMERDDAHRRRLQPSRRPEDEAETVPEEELINLEHFDVPLREFIAAERPRNEIKRRFRHFLNTFTQQNTVVYHQKIVKMAQRNEQSLEIEIGDIIQSMSIFAAWIVEAPKDMLAILDEVAREVVLALFPYYDTIHKEIYVRILDLPGTEKIRDLRTAHLNFLIKVSGVVTRRTSVFPQLQLVKFNCVACGAILGPFTQSKSTELSLNACPECQSKGPFSLNTTQTIYRNYQKLTLQESPGSVPPGRVPRSKEVILLADLIDRARPGDEVAITGVYTNAPDPSQGVKDGFPVFRTVIEANHIERTAEGNTTVLTMEDKKRILALSKRPDIGPLLIRSIAPSIYGHEHVKTALCLSLFGGKPKFIKNSRVRGDLNILMVGDPGTAKSQFLKFVNATAPRAVYTTGKGASAVGLTAGVSKDPLTKEWVLQGGALVLADKGVCLIDEFDKMNEQDRTSIHEAMEQQTISVSKAGIVTSLQARCAVIAAANPIGGRYNATRTFAENVELTDPILQRFDVLCVVQDKVDPVQDERLANFVISSHIKSNQPEKPEEEKDHPTLSTATEEETIDQEMLRKYIVYARSYVNPTVSSSLDTRKIETFYSQLRKASQHTGAVPIAVRHIESLFRMAEAYARMHLRDSVCNDDLDMAIRVMTNSLCEAQKFTFKRQWRKLFSSYLSYQQDNSVVLMHIVQELFQAAYTYHQLRQEKRKAPAGLTSLQVTCADVLAKARTLGIVDLSAFYDSAALTQNGYTYDLDNQVIVKTF
ncbi:DNA replication licensing factor Mcm2 [Thraustotheca clavata]|uniref:DNA replication licensing factor MCM2 n=1 Tax=Thraustotheca clavata TaxID=74557 RepID=A0A1W0A0F1_9STRA|nr:DNA replication licensing factor Mcm2 [Thraustotheca clavata]